MHRFTKFHPDYLTDSHYWEKASDLLSSKEKLGTKDAPYMLDLITRIYAKYICHKKTGLAKYEPISVAKKLMDGFLGTMGLDEESYSQVAGVIRAAFSCAINELENGKNYAIAKDFYDKFSRVSLNSLTTRHIPEFFTGYVQFPGPLHFKHPIHDSDPEKLVGMYLTVLPSDYLKNSLASFARVDAFDIADDYLVGAKTISVQFVNERNAIKVGGNIVCPEVETSIPDLIKSFKTRSGLGGRAEEGFYGYDHYFQLAVNLLVYISSGDPDLRHYKNKITYRSETSTKPVKADNDLSQSDIYLVGYNWKKETLINYGEKTWDRCAHLRWQPCGPALSQRKLVWLNETTCTRKATVSTRRPQEENQQISM